MPFRFRNGQLSGGEVRRITTEQLDRAIAEFADDKLELDERIHQVRKRCKKLRALLRLCRPVLGEVYGIENRALRDAARDISSSRDRKVLQEVCERLSADELAESELAKPVATMLATEYRIAVEQAEATSRQIEAARSRLNDVRSRVANWPLAGLQSSDIVSGHKTSFARARVRMRQCFNEPQAECFHEWRKSVKTYLYQQQLLRDLWRSVMKTMSEEAEFLATDLGEDHDCTLFLNYLVNHRSGCDREAVRLLRQAANKRQRKLRKCALARGARLFALKPAAKEQEISSLVSAANSDFIAAK